MSSSLILPRHIDAAFKAFDLDNSGLLYVSDAVLALDSLLIACWGNKSSTGANESGRDTNRSANQGSGSKGPATANESSAQQQQQQQQQIQQQQQQVTSGSGSSTDSLTLPGVSRSKILQALKSALMKADVGPDEVAVSARPVVTRDIFQITASSLLAPLPNVSQADVDIFASFQSLNRHDQDKTRVDRRALRRAFFAEYDSDMYVTKDDDDKLDERIRSGSSSMITSSNGNLRSGSTLSSSASPTSPTKSGLMAEDDEGAAAASSSSPNGEGGKRKKIGTGKFDGIRNMIGCDELMLNEYAKYPQQGFSFDEWKSLVTVGGSSSFRCGGHDDQQ